MDAEQIAQKRFSQEDKVWNGPKFIGLGFMTLVICISVIYFMSVTTGCSLQVVPF